MLLSYVTPSISWILRPVVQPLQYPAPASGDLNSHPERPGDLELWPLTLKLVRNVSRGTDNLPQPYCQFRCFCDFSLLRYGQSASDWRDLWPWPLTFNIAAHVGDAGHCIPSLHQVWSSSVSNWEHMAHFRLIRLRDLWSESSQI